MAGPWDKFQINPHPVPSEPGPWQKFSVNDLPPGMQLDGGQTGEPPKQEPGFFDSFYKTVQGPRDILNGIGGLVSRPYEAMNRMANQTIDLGAEGIEHLRKGDILGGGRRILNGIINLHAPGLGAASEDAGESFDRGSAREGFGKTAGVGVNAAEMALAPRVIPRVANAVAETITPGMRGPMGRLIQADPRVAVDRALRPVPSDPGFLKRVPQTLAAIKEANGGEAPNGITEGTLDLIPATNRAIGQHQDAFGSWVDRAKGLRISGRPIIDATRESTGGMLPSEAPSANSLLVRAQQDYGADFSPEQLRERLHLLNERLSPFYNKAPGKQSAALADIPEAVLKAQRDAVANTLYRSLDPEGEGAGPRMIQSRTGDLIDIRDAAQQRNNSIVREQPVSPLGRMLSPIKALLHEVLPTPVAGSGMLSAEASSGRSLPLMRRAFNAVDGPVDVLPRPGSPLYPTGDPTRLLTTGDAITPPPADASFVRSAASTPDQFARTLPKALPSGSPLFTQGTSVPDVLGRPDLRTPYNAGLLKAAPSMGAKRFDSNFTRPAIITPPPADTSFVSGTPGMAEPPNPSRALPAAPLIRTTPPPADASGIHVTTGEPLRASTKFQLGPASTRSFSELGGKAGDVLDTVPMTNPVTGEITYIPRPRRGIQLK